MCDRTQIKDDTNQQMCSIIKLLPESWLRQAMSDMKSKGLSQSQEHVAMAFHDFHIVLHRGECAEEVPS
jgi:hypothetical protein